MNSISWLIYLGDLLIRVGGFLEVIFILAIIATVCYSIAFGFACAGEEGSDAHKFASKYYWTPLVIVAILGFINIVIPSKAAIIAISASEVTEELMNDKTTDYIVEYFKNAIKEPEKKETKK